MDIKCEEVNLGSVYGSLKMADVDSKVKVKKCCQVYECEQVSL